MLTIAMNWLILLGNDHSQTIENAELARNARRYCQNYTRILTLSSKAQTLLPVQEHGHGLSGCLYYLDQSQLCLLSLQYCTGRHANNSIHYIQLLARSKGSLQSVAADRPVFIKAYAPWCGTNAVFIP